MLIQHVGWFRAAWSVSYGHPLIVICSLAFLMMHAQAT